MDVLTLVLFPMVIARRSRVIPDDARIDLDLIERREFSWAASCDPATERSRDR